MDAKRSTRLLGGLALIGLVMAVVALLPPMREPTLLVEAFFDAGHVPLFLVFTFLILWLVRSTVPGPTARHYAIACAIVVLAGLGTEFLQKFSERDAGWTDFGRDLLGGGAALLLAAAVASPRRGAKLAMTGLALVLLGVGLAELGSVYFAYQGRDAAFPTLAGFEAPWESRFVHGHDADLTAVPAPERWTEARGRVVGRLDAHVSDYPSLSINEPLPDWTGFDTLEFGVWSELPGPVQLTVRIHDRQHDNTYLDRYNGVVKVVPGANRFSIPLREVRSAPRNRELDLESVTGVAFFLDHPTEPVRLWFSRIRLL